MKAIGGLVAGLGQLLIIGNWLGGAALHVYTIVVALAAGGWLAATITLILPGASELFWFGWSWYKSGAFVNGYTFYVLAYIVSVLGGFGTVALGIWLASLAQDTTEAQPRPQRARPGVVVREPSPFDGRHGT